MPSRVSTGTDARSSLPPEPPQLGEGQSSRLQPDESTDPRYQLTVDALRSAGCVFAEDEAAILLEATDSGGAPLEALVARRVDGEPLEQIVGWVEFAGLRLNVRPGVFVPRQRTALLAERTLAALREVEIRRASEGAREDSVAAPAPVLLEAFCGVGPVASAVAAAVPRAVVHVGDAQDAAVDCAVGNVQYARHVSAAAHESQPGAQAITGDAHIHGHRLDCLHGLPDDLRGRIDVIAAVPPYVPTTAADFLPREAVDFEPATALFGGTDGLDLVRRLIIEAPDWLAADGALLIEFGMDQVAKGTAFAAAHGLGVRSHLGEGVRVEDEWDSDDDEDGHTVVLELRRIR